jgi:hypothetical protein
MAHNAPMATQDPQFNAASYPVAVIMERVALDSRWSAEKWQAQGVVRDLSPQGTPQRTIVQEEKLTQVLFPGFTVRLNRDEAAGYRMNITSPQPRVFVLWRMEEGVARPEMVTVCYYQGTRWADSEENVDGVPLPVEMLSWMTEFVNEHFKPEPQKPKRYASTRDSGRLRKFE